MKYPGVKVWMVNIYKNICLKKAHFRAECLAQTLLALALWSIPPGKRFSPCNFERNRTVHATINFWQMYCPSQTPRLPLSSERIAPGRGGRALRARSQGLAPRSPLHWISKETIKVVVFQLRSEAPTYATPLMSLHKVALESNAR